MLGRSIAAVGTALAAIGATPTFGQSVAPQPALTAEQAFQLFTEAGFELVDRRPVNRCGGASNPRVAFLDLNDDGRAEAHTSPMSIPTATASRVLTSRSWRSRRMAAGNA